MITSKNDMMNELLRLKDEVGALKSIIQEKTLQAHFYEQERSTLKTQIDQLTQEKHLFLSNNDVDKLKLKNKKFELKEKERSFL